MLDLSVAIAEGVGMVLENDAFAKIERMASLFDLLKVGDNVRCQLLNGQALICLQILLSRQWSVADVLPKLSEVLGRAEKFRVSWYVFVGSFEKLLLQYWKVRPRF